MGWNGLYNTNKKTNRQALMMMLLLLFLDAIGVIRMVGFNLSQPVYMGYSILNAILIVGIPWGLYALWKYKV